MIGFFYYYFFLVLGVLDTQGISFMSLFQCL